MKKIVTLLMALTMVMSMMAMPARFQMNNQESQHLQKHEQVMPAKQALSTMNQQAMKQKIEQYQQRKAQSAVKKATLEVPSDTVKLEMNATIQVSSGEFWGYYYVEASMAAQNDSLAIAAAILYFGTVPAEPYDVEWSGEDVQASILQGIDTLKADEASVILHQEGDTTYAYMLLTVGSKVYQVTMKYALPEPNDIVLVNFTEPMEMTYYADYGDYYLFAMNDQYRIQLDIYTDVLDGEYTEDDMDTKYTGLSKITPTDTTFMSYYAIHTAASTIGDTLFVETDYFSSIDTIMYHVNMFYAYPAAKDTITFAFDSAMLIDGTLDYEAVVISAAKTDTALYIYLNTDTVGGTYTLADINADYSYLALVGTDTTYLSFIKFQATVTVEEKGALVHIEGLTSDTVYYVIDMPAKVEVEIFDPFDIDEESNVNKTYTEGVDDVEWDTQYFASYGVVDLIVTSADGGEYLAIEFFSESATVANGVYPIDESFEAPSVLASEGMDQEYQVYPSFFGTIDGQYLDKVWFMVSGSVTVADGSITIAALNSKGNTINITITLSGTDLKQTTFVNHVIKSLRKGQLVISHDGILYNAQGQVIK